MAKSAEAFRSIGEVAKLINVAPHVLRYWETQFTQLRPMKRPDGRRYYRPADLALAAGICELLRDDGLTIRGARKLIALDRGETVRNRGLARLAQIPEPEAQVALSVPAPAPHPVTVPPPRQITLSQTAPSPALWLTRLTELERHLQDMAAADPRWPVVRPAVTRLTQAMIALS
ncbi:MAG: MerR family transcriptional regulator [Alphaproteobacteria bacterium]|nr:MerR family transcriptional regulator [Alphaproteobacteria bacterium]